MLVGPIDELPHVGEVPVALVPKLPQHRHDVGTDGLELPERPHHDTLPSCAGGRDEGMRLGAVRRLPFPLGAGVEGVRAEPLVPGDAGRHELAGWLREQPASLQRRDSLPVDGVGNRAAHTDVVERRQANVQREEHRRVLCKGVKLLRMVGGELRHPRGRHVSGE